MPSKCGAGVCNMVLQDNMILFHIIQFVTTRQVCIEIIISRMQNEPQHPDVLRTRRLLRTFEQTWPISITHCVDCRRFWMPDLLQDRTTGSAALAPFPVNFGFVLRFTHWSISQLIVCASVNKIWARSLQLHALQLAYVELHHPRSQSLEEEQIFVHTAEEFHLRTGCDFLLTLECLRLHVPLQ